MNLYTILPQCILEITLPVHNIGTRQSSKGHLYGVRCNTTQYGLRSIHYSGVRLWNSLPNEIRDSHSLSSFRHKLKDYYLSIYKL